MKPETWFDHVLYVMLGAALLGLCVVVIGLLTLIPHICDYVIAVVLVLIVGSFCYMLGRELIGPPDEGDSHGV